VPSGSGAGGGNYIADIFISDPSTRATGLNPVFGSGKALIKWVGNSPD
jgi:hypothetical protein